MTSTTLKCANCNVVINELLTFLRNVVDFMDEESIHQLCTSTYSSEEIVKAKSLLYEAVPNAKKMPLRRKQDKKRMSRDLDDIIGLMKAGNKELFPIFAAVDLHRVPPVSFDHVDATRILKDILKMQSQINQLKDTTVKTEQFDQLKQEVQDMKYASLIGNQPVSMNTVNRKRGACLQDSFTFDSGPIGLQYVPINASQYAADFKAIGSTQVKDRPSISTRLSTSDLVTTSEAILISGQEKNETETVHVEAHTEVSKDLNEGDGRETQRSERMSGNETELASLQRVEAGTVIAPEPVCVQRASAGAVSQRRSALSASPTVDMAARITVQQCNESMRNQQVIGNCGKPNVVQDSEWHVVHRSKGKRYKLIGQRGRAAAEPDVKFRAADVKVPLFISNVSKEASDSDIISYIKEKTNETVVLKSINMKTPKKYNAYKLYVSKHKLHLFLDNQLWPDGVTFRRFVHFMYGTNKKGRSESLANN